jgi:hypothetical protein
VVGGCQGEVLARPLPNRRQAIKGYRHGWGETFAEDEAIVLEEDPSDEEASSVGPVKWVVPAWEVLAADRGGWRAGSKGLKVNDI